MLNRFRMTFHFEPVGDYLQDARLLQVTQWCENQLGFHRAPPGT